MPPKYLVYDIECIPETELQDDWLKEKAKLEGEGNTRDTRFEPIWAHKVICIGMLVLDENLHPIKGGCAEGGLGGGKSEAAMITKWSDVASGKLFNTDSLRLVDWYGAKFDVPVLQTRAFRYGLQLPWLYNLQLDNRGQISRYSKDYRDKYHGKHDDLSELWSNRGMFSKPHLENLARLMGLPGKVGIDGSKVYAAYKEQRFEEIDRYCMQDVIQTAFVLQRFQFLMGKLTLKHYRAAAQALLLWTSEQPTQLEFWKAIDEPAVLLSGHADVDDRRDDLVSPGSGGGSSEAAVQGAAGLQPETGS